MVFGHPVGLANLFLVELSERFSFYGMLTILGYYLYYTDGGLGLPKTTATGIVGAYGGLVYLSTVLGGWIADRLLGMERTVFYGGVVVMAGHIALALVGGLGGVGLGLTLVALGSGGLKANASSLLGGLYEVGDSRTDAGFTLFTSVSTSAPSSARWSPACCRQTSVFTTVSAPRRSGWHSACSSTPCSGATWAVTAQPCRTRCGGAPSARRWPSWEPWSRSSPRRSRPYFLSVGIGTSMSGVLARFYRPSHEFAYFGISGAAAVTIGLVVLAAAGGMSRQLESVR